MKKDENEVTRVGRGGVPQCAPRPGGRDPGLECRWAAPGESRAAGRGRHGTTAPKPGDRGGAGRELPTARGGVYLKGTCLTEQSAPPASPAGTHGKK